MSKRTALAKAKEQSKPLTRSIFSDITAEYFVQWLPSTIAMLSAAFNNLPLWAVVLIGSIVFFLVSFGLKTVRHRTERGTQEELQEAAPSAQLLDPASEIECPYKWVHPIADNDRNELYRCVIVVKCTLVMPDLNGDLPEIKFTFMLFNGSVYVIAVEESIKGYITFVGQRLNNQAHIVNNQASILRHASMNSFSVIQRLTSDEVKYIADRLEDSSAAFYFDRLEVRINGHSGDKSQQVPSQRMELPKGINVNGSLVT